jgi:DNA-binding GntR family transcriptional regulator
VEHVRNTVIRAILVGELRPGERLIEAKLASQLAVSQATVNQALGVLHSQQIVRKSLNRGTTVNELTLQDLEAMFAVRARLESLAARDAALAARSGRRVETLQSLVAEMRTAAELSDLPRFYIADYEFHLELYRLGGNPFLIEAAQAVSAAPFAYILSSSLVPLPTDYCTLAEDHQQVVDAVLAGPQQAEEHVLEKIQKWLALSASALTANQQSEGRL